MRVYSGAASLLFNVERPHWRENDLFTTLRSSLGINGVPDAPISAVRGEGVCVGQTRRISAIIASFVFNYSRFRTYRMLF